MRRLIERRTGAFFGTYRWLADSDRSGPPPLFGIVVRPRNDSWVRVEIVVLGRAVYITWGHQA